MNSPTANPSLHPETTPSPAATPSNGTAPGNGQTTNGSAPPLRPSSLPRSNRSARKSKRFAIYVAGFFAAIIVVLIIWKFLPFAREAYNGPVHIVKKERLQFAIVERGTMESQKNSEIHCHVKAGTRGQVASTIKWVIDDGTEVEKGQLLVQLDDSGFKDQENDQIIKVEEARAKWVKADQDYQIILSQNESDLEASRLQKRIKELELRKYLGEDLRGFEGEYQQLVSDIEGKIMIAKSNLAMIEDRAAWSQRMTNRGLQSRAQLEGDLAKLQSASIELKKLSGEKNILEKFTRAVTQATLEGALEEAKRTLDRVKIQAESKATQALSDKRAAHAILEQAENKLVDLQEEIRKCRIISPQKGLVVYYIPESSRYGGSSSRTNQVAQGETVTEGQKLMRIPNLNRMQVNVRVHEAMYAHIKPDVFQPTGFNRDMAQACLMIQPDKLSRFAALGAWQELASSYRKLEYKLAFPGQPAFVRVDAYPNRVFKGHVSTIANVASSADFSSDIKVYPTIVTIDEYIDSSRESLRPGMSAEVTIVADEGSEEVLTVPIQSVVGTIAMGAKRKIFVLNSSDEPEERDIEVGRSNEKMVEVRTGVAENERVVLNPRPLLTGDRAKLKPGTPGTQRGGADGFGSEKKKGKGKKGPGAQPQGPGPAGPEFRNAPPGGQQKQFIPDRKA